MEIPYKLHTFAYLSDKENGGVFYEKFRMYFIEIPLFEKSEQDCSSKIDCWIYILKNMENLDTIPFKGWLKTLDQLEETMRVASLDKNGRELYEASLKQYRDLNAVIAYQKDKNAREREEARAKGLAEGRAEGRAEGIAKGRAEGEAKERLKSARKLITEKGWSVAEVSEFLELTPDEINQLQ